MNPTFIIGAGRCGSTLVSRLLRKHPDVLSLSEFFATMRGSAFPDRPLTGSEFWGILSSPLERVENLLAKGGDCPEILYPFKRGIFSLQTGVPRVLLSTFPFLTADPDGLYFELEPVVQGWPCRGIGGHCEDLFAWLSQRFSRPTVVERSGSSLGVGWVSQLHHLFPNARFVYLYRNGPDCALSMSRSALWRMQFYVRDAVSRAGVLLPSQITERQLQQLPEMQSKVVRGNYGLEELMSDSLPLTRLGEIWSTYTCDGIKEIGQLPTGAWISISFDSILKDPGFELAKLARFIGVASLDDWTREAARIVDGSRAGSAKAQLDKSTFMQIEEACSPGTQALRLFQ